MQGAGTLELIAELAVALLGFSGVVAVLGGRASSEWSALDSGRFFGMVKSSVLVLAMALVPFPFFYAGFDSVALWSSASAISALLCLLNVYSFPRAGQGGWLSRPSVFRRAWHDEAVSRPALLYLVFVQWVGPAILLLNAFGIFFDRTFTPYIVALLLHFVTPVMLFVRLLNTTLGGGDRAA